MIRYRKENALKERRRPVKKDGGILLIWLLFEVVAVTLWLTLHNIFYLFNFSIYRNLSCARPVLLYKKRYARHVVQFAVGLYMLVYLGILSQENMQIEGFWYYLFSGVFEAAVIHYAVAKIFGPLLFGRGWCGYACWTAMVLDLLPFKTPQSSRKRWGFLRYVFFILSPLFVGALFLFHIPDMQQIMFWCFLAGNALYYAAFSLLRVKNDTKKCASCGACKRACPMDVDIPDNSRKRKNATECILCMQCVETCSKKSLHL